MSRLLLLIIILSTQVNSQSNLGFENWVDSLPTNWFGSFNIYQAPGHNSNYSCLLTSDSVEVSLNNKVLLDGFTSQLFINMENVDTIYFDMKSVSSGAEHSFNIQSRTNGGTYSYGSTRVLIDTSSQWKKIGIPTENFYSTFKNDSLSCDSIIVVFESSSSTINNREGTKFFIDNIEVHHTANIEEEIYDNYHFKVFPNPAKQNMVYVESDFNFDNIYIINLLGEVISTNEFNNIKKCAIDLSDMPSGAYLISIQSKEAIKTKTFIKE